MRKFTYGLKFFTICLFLVVLSGFVLPDQATETASEIQSTLSRHYNVALEGAGFKKYELNITNTGFCRYKKYYTNGKSEFFSFNMSRFKSMEYLGSTTNGKLLLSTLADDVIVQTYQDRSGDVDSMATEMIIPLKDIEADDLNRLSAQFLGLRKSLK